MLRHPVKLLVIGESKKSRCFKGEEQSKLPVKYTNQHSAWMDKHVSMDWYENVFIAEVREKHSERIGKPRKVLLLMDNASSHPSVDELKPIDPTTH